MSDWKPKPELAPYDLESVYDAEIFPLMAKVIEVCKAHNLPMFATFAYARTEGAVDTKFCTTMVHDQATRDIPELRRLREVLQGYFSPSLMAITITKEKS